MEARKPVLETQPQWSQKTTRPLYRTTISLGLCPGTMLRILHRELHSFPSLLKSFHLPLLTSQALLPLSSTPAALILMTSRRWGFPKNEENSLLFQVASAFHSATIILWIEGAQPWALLKIGSGKRGEEGDTFKLIAISVNNSATFLHSTWTFY